MASRWLIVLCLLSGCVVGQMMTQEHFDSIQVGMTLHEVEELVGKPWEYQPIGPGVVQGVYCERLSLGAVQCERRYTLTYEQGRLVSKRQREQQSPGKSASLSF